MTLLRGVTDNTFTLSRSLMSFTSARNIRSSAVCLTKESKPPPDWSPGLAERRMAAGVSYFPDFVHKWGARPFKVVGAVSTAAWSSVAVINAAPSIGLMMSGGALAFYWWLGLRDLNQRRHAVRKNFPVLGHLRYVFEVIRPEIRQYFVESDIDGRPFSREQRSQVYQRAKNLPSMMPFGTRAQAYEECFEWANHSMWPQHLKLEDSRVLIGTRTKNPYSSSLLNVSGMSYGALSDNAVLALNTGARLGNFYHNTGEGGISQFHKIPGGDIVWNIGTGYFGCRKKDGTFCEDMFKDTAANPAVKMIEVKLSQGAKPGKGGVLPGAKVTTEIALARGVVVGEDCISPSHHSAFTDPRGLLTFMARLREVSGKPVGFKLCVGQPDEFAALVHAMLDLGEGSLPDFISVDGGEGGTGAAPPEFSTRVGMPLREGLSAVNNFLTGANLRKDITIIASGRIVSGFDIVRTLALGADVCNSARAMMFALGCIQALQCNTNRCPTGVATQDKELMSGLDVNTKAWRVFNYQKNTSQAALDVLGAMGLKHTSDLKPEHLYRRMNTKTVMTFNEIYNTISTPGCFVDPSLLTPAVEKRRLYHWWKLGRERLDSNFYGS